MRICKNEELQVSFDKYDLEVENDSTFIVEGCVVHNSNCRVMFYDDKLYVGSRSYWRKEGDNTFWKAINAQRDGIEAFCRAYPEHILYGEVAGFNKGFNYGCKPGEVNFWAFDIMKPDRTYIDAETLRSILTAYNIGQVPSYGVMPYNFDMLAELVEKPSPYFPSNVCMEGVVVKPLIERNHDRCGRVSLKLVSNTYLEKS